MFVDIPARSTTTIVFEALVLLFINFVAFVGNFLVCLASFRNRQLRTTTNLYVIALATSDILAACITMPLTFGAIIEGRWIFGIMACNIQGFFVHFLIYASMHTMALTAINRYFRIVKPQQYKKIFGGKQAGFFLVLVWVLVAIIVVSPALFGWARFEFHPGTSLYMCILYFHTKFGEVSFLLTILVFYVALSLIVMAMSYARVSKTIRRHNLQLAGTMRLSHKFSGISVEEIRITKTLFVLVLVFAICWIPVYTVVSVVRSGVGSLPQAGSVLASYMIFITSSINPFIYAFRNKAFRQEFKNILICCTSKSTNEKVVPLKNDEKGRGDKELKLLSVKEINSDSANIGNNTVDKVELN